MDLPELPIWFIHAFFGAASFILIVAAVLLLVQFPERLVKVEEWIRRGRYGYYEKLADDDLQLSGPMGMSSSATPVERHEMHRRTGSKRQRPDLSIDTSAPHVGLGISLPNNEAGRPKTSSSRSAGLERAWVAFTSPLLHIAQSTPVNITSPEYHDIEEGTPNCFTPMTSNPHDSDHHSATEAANGYDTRRAGVGSTFVFKLNDIIIRTTDHLTKKLHDQIREPEDGLLLPIKENERESAVSLTDGIAVA